MTTNQLTKAHQSLTAPVQGLRVRNNELIPSPAFLRALQEAIELEDELKQFFGAIKTFMEVHNVKAGEGAWGYLKLNPQRRLAADLDVVKPRFLTAAPNTEMIRAYQKMHGGSLPTGITEKVSLRLSKKVKE